jgi:hypothetical protein
MQQYLSASPWASNLTVWIVACIAVAVAGTNLAWLLTSGPLRLGPLARLAAWRGTPALAWFAVALFLLLPPVAAWRLGLLSPYFMGLSETDWLAALGAGGGLMFLTAGLLVGGWLVYRRGLRTGNCGPPDCGEVPPDRWVAPLGAILWQWHWAFYRAAAIAVLAAGLVAPSLPTAWAARLPWLGVGLTSAAAMLHAQPVYWGSWLGLLLAGLEFVLDPFAWRHLRTPGRLEATMRAVGIAIATTALFALTRNFWLCLVLALVVETAVAGWFPVPLPE